MLFFYSELEVELDAAAAAAASACSFFFSCNAFLQRSSLSDFILSSALLTSSDVVGGFYLVYIELVFCCHGNHKFLGYSRRLC